MVLGNDGLLGDILLRVDSPATLVRAALVSKSWFHGASFPYLLRRFRELHPPRLLGVYVTGDGVRHTKFVRVPNPQPEDLAARANLDFGAGLPDFCSFVWDVRDGRVLYEFSVAFLLPRYLAMRAPLQYPGLDARAIPPPPRAHPSCPNTTFLVPESGDQSYGRATCLRVDLGVWDRVVFATVFVLKPREDGEKGEEWNLHCYCAAHLPVTPVTLFPTTLLAGGKVYVLAAAGFVLGLDLADESERFFAIGLPRGVTCNIDGSNVDICRGDGGALCLVHVDGNNLSVWAHRVGAGWVRKHTIPVKETCADFLPQPPQQQQQQVDGEEVGPDAADGDNVPEEQVGPELLEGGDVEPEPADGDDGEVVPPPAEQPIYYVVGAGENAEYVFLELDDTGVIVYVHVATRKVEKVYQRDPDDDNVIRVHPFTMVWPLNFPVLR